MNTLIGIGELSSNMGISIRAIRYYEEIGLLTPCKTMENNYRYYSDSEKGKLGMILILKKMGLSLREIKTVFNGVEPDAFIRMLDEHMERLQKDKAEILLKEEILGNVLSHFKGDPLEALQEVSMKKTDEIHHLLQTNSFVKVIGVGSSCIPVLEGLKNKDLDVIHIDYEGEPLSNSSFSKSIQLQGSSHEIGIQEEIHQVRKAIEETELLFILTSVDNGIASTIVQEAQKLGIHTVGILIDSAMGNEVNVRVQEFINHVDLLFDFSERTSNSHEDFIVDAVVYVSSLILNAHINIRRDIQSLMKKKGRAYLGIGKASGLNKADAVMEQLFSSAFLHHNVIENASSALLNITASDDLTMPDVERILNIVRNKLGRNTNLIFGTVIDHEASDTIAVALILAGFSKKEEGGF